MYSFSGVALFLGLIFGSLLLVSLINRIQMRNRLVAQKIRQMRRRLDELEDIASEIEPLLEAMLVPKLINDEILNLITSIRQLESDAEWLDVRRAQAQDIADKLNNGQRTLPFYRIKPSDAAIARSKYALTEAARIVRRHNAIGRINAEELASHIKEMAWAHLMVDVISHIAQGHKAVNRNDLTVAYGYYRKAQNILMTANNADDRRHKLIRQIGEIFSGNRLAITEDLMPEKEFNPTQKPDFKQLGAAL